jgi:hypothetical protein
MQDEVSRKEFVHLAVQGKTPDLGANLLAAAREHSAKAAQWQINRSIRELTSGPVNAYVASENLANILAARELADGGNAGEQITNGAFRARAERLRADPSFQRLARRYSEDPTFRRRMSQKLMEDRSAGVLQEVYKRVSASAKVQEEKQKDPLAEAQPVQPGKPEPERGPELAAAL